MNSPTQLTNVIGHLIRQLTSRAKHQRLYPKALDLQFLQNTQAKGRRLAGAGFRLGDNIPIRKNRGQAKRLNRGHCVEIQSSQIIQKSRIKL